MKRRFRILSLALSAAVAAGVLSPSSAAARPVHVEEGTVAMMLRFPADTESSYAKPQRDIWNNTGQNGQFGYVIPIDERTWGGQFVLEVLDGATGQEDIDITFYSYMAPQPGSAAVSPGDKQTREAGGEVGKVPPSATNAIVTLATGANASFRYSGFAGPKPAPLRVKPAISSTFGRTAPAKTLAALKKKSHVVIALVDTGINPYHASYRRPAMTVHPSLYIEGFPKSTPALNINLDQKDYAKARNFDDGAVWGKVKPKTLYWIPGTNIIGAYSNNDVYDPNLPVLGDSPIPGVKNMGRPIIDDSGHGTGVSSVSAGGLYGSNPDALIVVVEGFGTEAVKWAASQPWIDFISGSYGDPLAIPFNEQAPRIGKLNTPSQELNDFYGEVDSREYEHTGPFVLRDGRTACFSAGNGLSRTGLAYDRYSSIRPTSGPSWIVTVGAVSPKNNQNYGWHSVPVDISSYGNFWPAADYASTSGVIDFSGTSSATPVTCGVFSKALLEARKALGDAREGIHVAGGKRVPAAGKKARGLLADGVLTREELQDAVFKTALPGDLDPTTFAEDQPGTIPTTPGYYTQQGYGIANKASALRAINVILGRSAMPDRTDVDQWIATVDTVRNAIWDPADYR